MNVYPLEDYKQHALVELGGIFAGIFDYESALEISRRLEAIADELKRLHVEQSDPPATQAPSHLDVIGIHVGAVTIAAQQIARLTGEDPSQVSRWILQQGRAYCESSSPQDLGDRCKQLLDAAKHPPDESA